MTTSPEVERSPDVPDVPPDVPSDGPGASAESPATVPPAAPPAASPFAVLRNPRLLVPVAVTAGIVLLWLAYLAQARTQFTISEGASQALQGWDLLHGNLLLHGWSLSDVSFYTTELPEYALVEWVRGLSADTVPVAAALSYFLQVLMAGFLAKGRSTGREAIVRVLVAVGIMLAPPLGPATALLMSSPDHTGTHVPLLLIYLVLDRVRPRWWLPIVIMVLLTWAEIADTLVLVEAVVPIVLVCLVRMYRRRGPWRGQVYDLSLVIAAGLSTVLTKVILQAILSAGGFYVRTPVAQFGVPGQIGRLFWYKIENVLLVYGADFFGQILTGNITVQAVHFIGLILVIWAIVLVVRRFYAEDDQIAQMLTVAFVVVLAAYIFGTKPDSNEIVGLLPIGAVVAGRVLGPKIIKARLVPALGVVFLSLCVMLIGNAVTPPARNPNTAVGTWLQRHHYTYGLGGYWNASSVTAETGGNVRVRPVRTYVDGVVATNFETDSTWYDPNKHYANFVVGIQRACGNLCLTRQGLIGAFGEPQATHFIGRYVVYVYDKNLLRAVSYVSFCSPAWPWVAKSPPSLNLHCNSGN